MSSDQAYITELERFIIMQWNRGAGADAIAELVGLDSAEEVRTIYIEADRKAITLFRSYEDQPLELSIYHFLEEIGIYKTMWGAKELAAAIQLAVEQPDLMNYMKGGFFPVLAAKFDTTPSTVHAHMSPQSFQKSPYHLRREQNNS